MALIKKGAEVQAEPDRFIGIGVFFFSFAVYLITLAPDVTFWDSGELVLGAVSLGNPHPPAYPLFCLLGKGCSFMPLGSAAYRVNLASAFFAAAAVYLVFRLVAEMGEGRTGVSWVAAGLALSFAFIRNLWGVSVVSEVYSLNAFLLAGTVYLLLLHDKGGRLAFLYASAFLLGLALVNHQSVLMFIPAFAAYHLASGENYKRPKVLLHSLFFFLLGYSLVLYLPVRGAATPAINIGDPRDLASFMWLIKWPEVIAMVEHLVKGGIMGGMKGGVLLYMALGLAICAAAAYVLRKKRYLLMLLFSALLYYAGTSMVTAPSTGIRKWGLHSKFYIPVYLFIGLTAVAVLFQVWRAGPGKKTPGAVGTAALAVFCLMFPMGVLAYNYDYADNSRNFFARDFASNTLKSVRQDAAFFAWGDNGIFPVWYLQGVERFRDDVLFIHTELLTYPWYMADRRAVMKRKYGVWYTPPLGPYDLNADVPNMRRMIENATPTYIDFSAAQHLGYNIGHFRPQGLAHLASVWDAEPLGRIWGAYVLRGAFDNTTNKEFAAEGILDIYAWECAVWAQVAYMDGRAEEALSAYDLAKNLGVVNEELDRWAEDLRKSLSRKQKM